MPKAPFKRVDKRKGVKRETHCIPDQIDLEIWDAELKKLSKSLDENGMRRPITETELVGWVRKKLDEIWMICPTKCAFLESKRVPDYDPTTRRQSKWQCALCGEWFGKTDVQVDHISGEHEFTKLEQLTEFANKRFMVGFKDLQILDVECHETKTHAERHGLSIAEARIDKQSIAICKTKKEKEWLIEKGITPATNAAKRRIQIFEYLKENP